MDSEQYTVVYRAQDLVNEYDPHSTRNSSGHSYCGVDVAESEDEPYADEVCSKSQP